jgi:hypothetical protein
MVHVHHEYFCDVYQICLKKQNLEVGFCFRRQAAEEKEMERQAASRMLATINNFSLPKSFVCPEKTE